MPQEFHVLKCFSCETFQVHIVKKVKKWECKMCGTKQSLKRNYGKGSSKDCRNHVMKLNELRVTKTSNLSQVDDEETWTDDLTVDEFKEQKPTVSKWAEYVEESIPDSESETEDILMEFVGKKKKRVKKMPDLKKKKFCKEPSESELFSKNCEEPVESFENEKVFDFDKTEENFDLKNEPKSGKYSKYLQDNSTFKTSNIFESSVTDLDDVLNF